MEITFELLDADALACLQEDQDRWDDLEGALEELGAELLERQLANIESGGARSIAPWPALAPATLAIRKHYGHGRKPLIRGGELFDSLSYSVEDGAVTSGSSLAYADVVDRGGTVPGTKRTLPARPFLEPSESDHDELFEIALDHLAAEFVG